VGRTAGIRRARRAMVKAWAPDSVRDMFTRKWFLRMFSVRDRRRREYGLEGGIGSESVVTEPR
jgi:hypothetical protein